MRIVSIILFCLMLHTVLEANWYPGKLRLERSLQTNTKEDLIEMYVDLHGQHRAKVNTSWGRVVIISLSLIVVIVSIHSISKIIVKVLKKS